MEGVGQILSWYRANKFSQCVIYEFSPLIFFTGMQTTLCPVDFPKIANIYKFGGNFLVIDINPPPLRVKTFSDFFFLKMVWIDIRGFSKILLSFNFSKKFLAKNLQGYKSNLAWMFVPILHWWWRQCFAIAYMLPGWC